MKAPVPWKSNASVKDASGPQNITCERCEGVTSHIPVWRESQRDVCEGVTSHTPVWRERVREMCVTVWHHTHPCGERESQRDVCEGVTSHTPVWRESQRDVCEGVVQKYLLIIINQFPHVVFLKFQIKMTSCPLLPMQHATQIQKHFVRKPFCIL